MRNTGQAGAGYTIGTPSSATVTIEDMPMPVITSQPQSLTVIGELDAFPNQPLTVRVIRSGSPFESAPLILAAENSC